VRVGGPHPPALRPGCGRAPHDAADDGEAEGGGLPRAGLRAGHEVPRRERDGDGVPLHGRRAHVLAAADVVVERGAEVDLGEGGDGRRHVAAARLDGDVLVRVEVDPRVLVVLERGRVRGRRRGVGRLGLREGVRLAVPGPPPAGTGPAAGAEAGAATVPGAGEQAGGGAGRRRGGRGGGGGGGGAVAEVGREVGGAGGAVGRGRGSRGGGGGGWREGLGVGYVGPGRAGGGRRHGGGSARRRRGWEVDERTEDSCIAFSLAHAANKT
jgi:hypothetical protein